MIKFKDFILEHKKYQPTEDEFKVVYNLRRLGKSTNAIMKGDKEFPGLGYVKHTGMEKLFDSPEAQQRDDYHPPVAKWQRVNPRDKEYKRLYRLRKAGNSETYIQRTLGIHKDTIAKYYDSGEAQLRDDYHPTIKHGNRK